MFLAFSLPGFDLWWLAWIGFAPLLAALAESGSLSRRRAFLLGETTGVIFFFIGCHWVTNPVVHYGGLPRWVVELMTLAAVILVAAFTGLMCAVIRDLVIRGGPAWILTAPVWYLLFEWLRLNVTTIGWNSIAYSQAFHPALIQFAEIAGFAGVGFLIVWVSAAMAWMLASRNRRSTLLAAGVIVFSIITVVTSYFLTGGNREVEVLGRPSGGARKAHFLAVQPELPISMDATETSNQQALSTLLSLTDRALQDARRVDGVPAPSEGLTVIWPESPLYVPVAEGDPFWHTVTDYCRRRQVSLIFNTARVDSDLRAFNSVLLIDPRGGLVGEYRKIHLLLFGEYIPFRSIIPWLDRVPALASDFTPGTDSRPLKPAEDLQVGPFVCSESAFPDLSRRMALDGADVLVNVSNDGWFGSRIMAKQHLAHSIFRAVENGRPLLQVTNGGMSAYVSERGVIKELWPAGQARAGFWQVDLSGGTGTERRKTLYTRWGDWFTAICLLLGLCSYGAVILGAHASSVRSCAGDFW